MRPPVIPLVLLLAACATPRLPSGEAESPPGQLQVLQQAELARVRCLLVAPLENGSNVPGVSVAATGMLLSSVDPERTRVLPIDDLRAVFADTPLELPEGVSTSTAVELAELLGADAVLHGSVEGRSRDVGTILLVTLRLTLAGGRDVLFASNIRVEPALAEPIDAAVKRAVQERARPMFERLGGGGPGACFPQARREALRQAAVALRATPLPSPPARPAPQARPPSTVVPAAETDGAGPERGGRSTLHTARQREWARVLEAGGRLLLDEVAFTGRTTELARDGGLADLAVVLAAAPGLKVRLEGFVDATGDRVGDVKLSVAMARSALRRLQDLGVESGRVQVEGRGGENPVVPNFTARGRAANRRVEAVSSR